MNTKNKLTLALKALLLIACFNVFIHHLALAQTPPFSFTFEKIIETGDQIPGIPLDTFLGGTPSFSEPSLNGSDLTFVGQKNGANGYQAIYSARANSFNLLANTNTPFPEEAGVDFGDFNSASSLANITDKDSDGIPDVFDNDPDAIADGSCTEIDGVVGIAFVTYTGSEYCSASSWISTGLNVTVDASSEVLYEAGESIHLFPGFQVKKGGLFSAFISEDSNPEIYPPLISAFVPNSGPIGTLVTLSGNNFAPGPGLVPEVLMRKQGGGTQRVPIAGFDNKQIRMTVPPGTDSGSIKVQVGELSRASSQNFTVQTSSDYQLQAEPATAQLIQGHSIVYSIELSSNNGFNQLAALQINGLPAGMLAEFTPQQIAAGQQAKLTLTAAPGQTLGNHNFTVTADAEIDGFPVTQTVNLSTQVIVETTSFMGQAVRADSQQTPLAGVSIHFLGRDGNGNPTGCSAQTTSDAAGNFVFTNLPPECTGDQLVRYDGLTVANLSGDYAGVDLYYNIADGIVTESPVLVHLPRIDDKETVMVKQNWPEDQRFTFASIPNLEATVYAGTTLTLVDGSQPDPFPLIAIDVPIDRLPEEMPPGDTIEAFIVAFQPANAEASQPVAVTFPNQLNTAPGTQMPLSTLDPTKGVMVVYGTGTVSADGTKIIPDLDPANPGQRFGLVHFDWHGPNNPNNPGNQRNPDNQCNTCPCPGTDNPVDFASGIETVQETDIAINGLRGSISIQRTYRTISTQAGPFGIGTNHNYGYRLNTNRPQDNLLVNLIMPDGNWIPFSSTDNGFRNSTLPITLGIRMDVEVNGEVTLKWKNGTIFHFVPSTVQIGSVLESITDTNGNRISLRRNPADAAEITEIIDPVGRTLRLTYDAANRITSIIDPIRRQVNYTYNAQGTLETVTDPENGITRYDYNAQNRLTKITDSQGVVVAQNTYNQNGRIIEQIQADGGIIKMDYTLANPTLGALSPILKTVVTDPLGNISSYRFSPQGMLLDVTDALGQTRIYEREPGTNQLLAIKGTASCSVCGNTAAGDQFFNYDTNGNLLTQTDALGHTTSYTYEPLFNKVKTITDSLSHITSFEYDTAGNLLSSTDQNNNITSFQYNEFGLLTEITDPLGASTSFAYDGFGNQISTTDALGNTSLSRYDAISRLIKSVDALGAVNTSQYDQLNRVIATTDARGNTTVMEYDAIGNLLSLTDARNNTTSFTYDGFSRVKTRTDSNGKTEISRYDLNGNLIEFTDRRGQHSTFNYDAFDRLVHEQYQDGNTVERLYDPRGQLLQAVDSSGGVFSFAYDLSGRLLQSIGSNGTVVYDRDALGRVSKRQVVGQDAVDYAYDPVGNLLSAAMPLAAISSSYDQRNQLTQQIRDNSVVTDYSYDIAGRLLNIKHSKGLVILESLTYSRDARGNIIGKESNSPQAFTTQPSILSVEDDSNRLVQRADISYTHDENGNRLTETGAQGVTRYTWDSRNRLQSISTPDGLISRFRYDFSGNLIEQLTQGQNIDDSKQFVLDDLTNVVLQENNNFEQLSVLTGRSIDQHLATTQGNGKVEYALSDSINSTVLTTDENGGAVGEFSYEPFGVTASSDSNYSYQFTGRVPVSNDFYYYRARFYDPLAGRFGSEDPIGFLGGVNMYAYVSNNPLNFTDAFGLCPDCSKTCQEKVIDDVLKCLGPGTLLGSPICLPCLFTGNPVACEVCAIAVTALSAVCGAQFATGLIKCAIDVLL